VVQRAILDVCQTKDVRLQRWLGQIPEFLSTPTSVGGIAEKGSKEAIRIIVDAIQDGANWFIRSDLKNFFTQIPKDHVEEILRNNISDDEFVSLFMSALQTELSNEDEVRDFLHIFPLDELGVPQGSSLSALCGNIVLAEFDRSLNGRGISTVRYLDDFLILGPTKRSVGLAWRKAIEILGELGMEAHDPQAGTGKASSGRIDEVGVDFLSFHIRGTVISPSRAARTSLIKKIRDTIREDKRAIAGQGSERRRAERRFVQSLATLDRQIRGWGDAFQVTSDRVVFHQVDREIDKLLHEYRAWFGRQTTGQNASAWRRLVGVAVLADTPHHQPTALTRREVGRDLSDENACQSLKAI
jgi:hypothetical protein